MYMKMDEESQGLIKARAVALPLPPKEKVTTSYRKTTWVLRMSSAMAASFFLVLLFTIALVHDYSQGIEHISAFAATTLRIKKQVPPYPLRPEYSITCNNTTSTAIDATCPGNYHVHRNASAQSTCPEYFRWIHEDLKPWKKQGITLEMLEDIERHRKFRHFRLTIVNGTAYVKMYDKAFQTRDTFTLWGVLQLLKLHPGKLPDVDLIFQCHDRPSIRKDAYEQEKAPPLFHYCGSDDTYDISFPDWSFWGWPEINIKPWASFKKDLEEGNHIRKWTEREPYAFWRGNLHMGDRRKILRCNSTKDWNTLIYNQDWKKGSEEGFKNTDLSKQCTYQYKIYLEGIAWSVSRKYILACDSMTLLINPRFYDFYTRNLIPMKHFWPVDPNNLCESLKYAVDWGTQNPDKAQAIGREGSKFIQDSMTMQNVYDYMFHLLSEYGKLMRYKPTVPPGAVELCSEFWVCAQSDLERAYKFETTETGPATDDPCTLPPPFMDPEMEALKVEVAKGNLQAQAWEVTGKPNV